MSKFVKSFAYWGTVALFLISLLFSPEISKTVQDTFNFITTVLFTGIFPFLLLGCILTELSSNTVVKTKSRIGFAKLFGLPQIAMKLLFVGAFCGFPSGALAVKRAYQCNALTQEEASRLLLFSTLPSPAFCITILGENTWNNRLLGLCVYLATLCGALTLGFCFNLLSPITSLSSNNEKFSKNSAIKITSVSEDILNAVKGAIGAFSRLAGLCFIFRIIWFFAHKIATHLGVKPAVLSTIYCLIDLAGGTVGFSIFSVDYAPYLVTVIFCLQGISVFLQQYDALRVCKVKISTFSLFRCFHTVISLIFLAIFINFL